MDEERTPFCVNINKYRRRRRYRRLNKAASDNENVKITSSCRRTHQRFGKIQLISRRIRDAYVDMMLRLARHVAKLNNSGNVYFLVKNAPDVHRFIEYKGFGS